MIYVFFRNFITFLSLIISCDIHLTQLFQGTTAEQDNRFSDKEKKLLKQMRFGDCLTRRVSIFSPLYK